MTRIARAAFALLLLLATGPAAAAGQHTKPRNVIVFVADGLRYGSVTPALAPNMAKVKRNGVDFANSHALFPTLTTVNASAIATGHDVGDTGNFANVLYTGFPVAAAHGSEVPFLESNSILAELNAHFGGNYIHEVSLVDAARKAGFNTAVIGKRGPAYIQALTASPRGTGTIMVDGSTGHDGGFPPPPGIAAAMRSASIAMEAPPITKPDRAQEQWLAQVATRVVLPRFKAAKKPFVMVFWSRDPDITQHAAKDSIGKLVPGINGPTSEAAVRNADDMLGRLLDTLKTLGIDKTTDVFVTADHGFATVSTASKTSPSAHYTGASHAKRRALPNGFLAIDIAHALKLPLFAPNEGLRRVDYNAGDRPSYGAGYVGADPHHPKAIVLANGGSGTIYLPGKNRIALARAIVAFLMKQDYVSGLFVNSSLGRIPGALSMRAINLEGAAVTPAPAIYVNFRSFSTGCADPLMCTVSVADSILQTGQGIHGGFSRAETRNFMAAIGPDFKKGFSDTAPVGNADIAPTLAHLLKIALPAKGALTGRVITEALAGGKPVTATALTIRSSPGPGGLRTVLEEQSVGTVRYFDAAGFPGRSVGVPAQ